MTAQNLDLNLLKIFVALWVHRSTTHAAAELGRSQSAVSHALTRLREYYGDPLFHRTSNGMEPTKRAEQLAGPLTDAFALIVQTTASAPDPRKAARHFRMVTVNYTSIYLLPTMFDLISREAPQVRFSVERAASEEAKSLLNKKEIDFAVGKFRDWDEPSLTKAILAKSTYSLNVHEGGLKVSYLSSSPVELAFHRYLEGDAIHQWFSNRMISLSAEIDRKFVKTKYGNQAKEAIARAS